MVDYGLTTAGFVPKTTDIIQAELQTSIRAITGLENVNVSPSSAMGNLIAVLTEREALIWALALLVWQSGFRDYATGLSLDNTVALIGNSRLDEAHSTVTLTLYNTSSTNPVTVPADSQARQSTTGVVWETLEDAEIPALDVLLTGIDVANITWQSGTTVRATLNGSPDLTVVADADDVTFAGCTNAVNNGTYTITDINTGSFWIEFTNSSRTSSTGNETGSPGTAEIEDTSISITVEAQSLLAGPYEASIASINEIVTPISGWDAVSNLEQASVGRNIETDAELRRRAALETVSADGGTLEAVKRTVEAVTGVIYVSAEENDTAATVGLLPEHSIHITVVGGDDQDIVDAIGTSKAAGISTYGGESGTWTDSTGNTHTIYFSRVDEINPYFIVNLTTDANYPADGDDLVAAAMEATEWDHGQDLLNYLLVTAIGAADIPGILTISVLQSLTVGPVASTNITIASTEVVNVTTDRITVNS